MKKRGGGGGGCTNSGRRGSTGADLEKARIFCFRADIE